MKKFFTLVLVVLVCTSYLFSAEPHTREGSKSLFFDFRGLSELSIDNSVVGFQYLFADKMGVWADLGFSSTNYKPHQDATEQKMSTLVFDVGFIYYAFQKGPIAFYVSPTIGIETGSDEPSSSTKTTTNIFYGGIGIGAEWWAFEGVSIGVYSFLGYFTQKTTSETASSKTESTKNIFGIIGDHSSSLFIAFHF